jgi:hypothetical protein
MTPKRRYREYRLASLLLMSMATWSVVDKAQEVAPRPVLDDRLPVRELTLANDVEVIADINYAVVPGFRPLTLDVYCRSPHRRPGCRARRFRCSFMVAVGARATRRNLPHSHWPGYWRCSLRAGMWSPRSTHRLSAEAPAPAAIHDVKNAVRWLRAHAERFAIHPTRAGVFGGSAGGQLAALLGTSCGVESLAAPQYADQNGAPSPQGSPPSDCVQSVVACGTASSISRRCYRPM